MRLDELVAIAWCAHDCWAVTPSPDRGEAEAVVDAALEGEELVYGLFHLARHARDERRAARARPGRCARHRSMSVASATRSPPRSCARRRRRRSPASRLGATLGVARAMIDLLSAHHDGASISSGRCRCRSHAAVGVVITGLGSADSTPRMLRLANPAARGLEPVRLEPKDGLAVVSANGFSIGRAALVLGRARNVLDAADTVAAVTMDAVHANPSILEPEAMTAKGIEGQATSAARMSMSSSRDRAHAVSVQDPLTMRVVPRSRGGPRGGRVRGAGGRDPGSRAAADSRCPRSTPDGSSATATSIRCCSRSRWTPSVRRSPISNSCRASA